ncbi:hypothetical protein Cyrtocomes_00510 [Candidatus Cyrtobacter comes]|uniref:Uncharacterized protein n=1 Tax=Candidatus Cyrtobacter comes TaxID=675776 RepID=A0ABU5L8B0_9RICK|nr:hypothetical protein [Candidatus Cyrtobacter comes]MDZ5762140.1 hypothetical protein [Candidatus Cyrtobacter comes]
MNKHQLIGYVTWYMECVLRSDKATQTVDSSDSEQYQELHQSDTNL